MGRLSTPIRETPLLNRAIQAQLAPGSVFKIVMATAMLESKAIPADFTVFCPGYANFYGRTFHCWRPAAHGSVDLHKAIVDSCDVFFYNVGQASGNRSHSTIRRRPGTGPAHGHRSAGRRARPGAFGGLGAARLPSQMVSRAKRFPLPSARARLWSRRFSLCA